MGKKKGRERGAPGEEEEGKNERKRNPTVRGMGEDRRRNLAVRRRWEEDRRRGPLLMTVPPPFSQHQWDLSRAPSRDACL